ncbi:hypothetical protein C8Q79DRAFT_896689 [Trametes meyenii]|nr:hypothetical protein C8Q79DRAFT_896689 [Trametes meyenii]
MNGDVSAVFALYRSCLRQIRRLPTGYLRQFFRLRVGDDVRTILDPRRNHLVPTKIARVQKDLRKLEGANAGYAKCFDYVLNTAYGRRGRLRWEILDPLLSEPGVPLPPRIIPAVESSRPPFISREMRALFTSDASRMTKALSGRALAHPPNLPPRADPKSPEAQALGPFSKRREVNLRRRFFQAELQKTMFPLQVVVEEAPAGTTTSSGGATATERRTDADALAGARIRAVGLQHSGVFEEIEALASAPRKQRRSPQGTFVDGSTQERPGPYFQSHLPTRFLRRRYQQLLARTPMLLYKPPRTTSQGIQSGKYQVTLSPMAAKRSAPTNRIASEIDVAWIKCSQKVGSGESKKSPK